jgi:signal transduction histidine kinase
MPSISTERRQTMLGSALRQTRRITSLAAGLLDIERVEQGKLKLDRRWVPVTTLAEHAVAAVPAETDVRLEVPLDLHVYADPERLEQVLINLTTNALRHGQPPIVISAEANGQDARIEVRDHGAGVPPTRVATLFNRLGGDADHPESVGLGMWIVRLLAEAHGGSVAYEPAGPGARFAVTIPGPSRGDRPAP